MKKIIAGLVLTSLLAGCSALVIPTPTPTPEPDTPVSSETPYVPGDNPYLPKSADNKSLTKGVVFPDSAELIVAESFPAQYSVSLHGNLPTPCHQLRVVVNPPDAENKVMLEAYSVVDPEMICAQVLAEFSAVIPLGTFAPGSYTVWVNGEQIGDFNQ